MSAVHDFATLLESAPEHDLEPVRMSTSVWDIDPAPWATFADALRLDALHRRQDALTAIVDWSSGDPFLRIEAELEMSRLAGELEDWSKDIDARQAAWHREHPGSDLDRRSS